MNANRNSVLRLKSTGIWLLWALLLFQVGFLFNLSFIKFLLFLSTSEIVFAFIEAIRLALIGWLLFTMFYRPGTRWPIPDKKIREKPSEIFKLSFLFLFVSSARVTLIETTRIIFEGHAESAYYRIIIIAIITSIVFIIYLWYTRRTKSRNITALYAEVALRKQALSKIHRRLQPHEQAELGELLYESNSVRQAKVQTIAEVFWSAIILALLWEIVEQIISRL